MWPQPPTSMLRALAGLAVCAIVLSVPYLAQSYPSGAPAGFNGQEVENGVPRTCGVSGCHDSYPLNSGTGNVSIQAPDFVQPGQTVPITVTIVNTTTPAPGSVNRQGFLAAVRDHTVPLPDGQGDFLGTLTVTDATNTRFPIGNNTNYVTHTTTGNQQTSWTFDWTAPPSPGGTTATVFVAGNAANGGDLPAEPGNNAAGDYIYTATRTIVVGGLSSGSGPDAEALDLATPHPNPTSGPSATTVTLRTSGTLAVEIVDGRGRTVREIARAPRAAGEHPVVLPTDGLSPGTYFVVAEVDGVRRTQPLVVVR